ncbi:MAG: hypothetical protein OEN20_06420 [Gammaproteobacteria bacterium]|nr:hypothetical protein [Gammaproteobacteria bacterium]
MTERRTKLHESPALVPSLGLACLSLLGGCGGSGGGGGSSGGDATGPIAVTSANAETLATAALDVAAIVDSLPASASRYGNSGGQVDCVPGSLEISTSAGDSSDTITTPSGNVISPPATGDTVLDYTDCLEAGYVKSGVAAVSDTGGGLRVRWMNMRLEHPLIDQSNVVGAAIFSNASGTIYRIDDLTVTQGSDSFYAVGQIDFLSSMPRELRFDVQLRFADGSAQVTAPQRLTGTAGMPFDGGELLIQGDSSSVTVMPQGGGFYRLEIDTDGVDPPEIIRDAVAL